MPEILIKLPQAIVCCEVPETSAWTAKSIATKLEQDGYKARVMGEFVVVEPSVVSTAQEKNK